MGRNTPKHTPEMRDAIVRAAAVEGYTADQVINLAAAGQLAGLPPFEVARSTIHDLVGRARRNGELVPAEEETESGKLSRKVADEAIARVEALGDKATPRDLAAVREAARILRDADRARRPAQLLQPLRQPAGDDSALARIQAAHDADVQAVAQGAPCPHCYGTPPLTCLICGEPNPHRPTAPTPA
jgi:transposase